MKKISWITPECFLDVDLPVIKQLRRYYQIKFIIVLPAHSIDYKQYVSSFFPDDKNIEIEFFILKRRQRSPWNLLDYNQIISIAKSFSPDLYYLSLQGMPYALPLYKFRLHKTQCIAPCHNVSTPAGGSNEKITRHFTDWWLRSFQNIHVFSENQYELLKEKYDGKNIMRAPLMIKDYGPATTKKSFLTDNNIHFLFFGIIQHYKRLDLLIEAGNELVRRGVKNFKIKIAGNCKNWEQYNALIQHPEYFETDIRRIPNEEVADLFASNDFFVMPYQDIAQSGAITVAFRYNLPTITSNIPQFREFIIKDETGYVFENKDAMDLADKMQHAIEYYPAEYASLQQKQKEFVEKNLSDDAIAHKYQDFFDSLIAQNNHE